MRNISDTLLARRRTDPRLQNRLVVVSFYDMNRIMQVVYSIKSQTSKVRNKWGTINIPINTNIEYEYK